MGDCVISNDDPEAIAGRQDNNAWRCLLPYESSSLNLEYCTSGYCRFISRLCIPLNQYTMNTLGVVGVDSKD